jgi:hypothetical protein
MCIKLLIFILTKKIQYPQNDNSKSVYTLKGSILKLTLENISLVLLVDFMI